MPSKKALERAKEIARSSNLIDESCVKRIATALDEFAKAAVNENEVVSDKKWKDICQHAVEQERHECAKVATTFSWDITPKPDPNDWGEQVAKAIRARGETAEPLCAECERVHNKMIEGIRRKNE